jgi:hypothetical protein
MSCDANTLTLHPAEQPITHPDLDQRLGYSFTARCDTATVYIGGAGVTSTGNTIGYDVPAGQEFGLDDASDTMHICVASADDGAVLKLFWAGV